jgi:hypothetical protein
MPEQRTIESGVTAACGQEERYKNPPINAPLQQLLVKDRLLRKKANINGLSFPPTQ